MAQVVVLEGPLKKRGATMPVMHDRYCVATWEDRAVVLRTFKSRAAYAEAPHKPVETPQTLKCISEWDGKGNFHTYPFGFTVETRDKKLLLCAAPSREDQRKWLELLTTVTETRSDVSPVDSGSHTTSSEQRHTRVADKSALFTHEDEDEDDEDEDYGKAAAAAVQNARRYEQERLPHAENDLLSDEDDEEDYGDDEYHNGDGYDSDDARRPRVKPVSPLALSPPDDKLLFRAGSTESLTSSLGNKNGDEPDDWGLYGESAQGDGPSRYDVVDGPVLSLDTDLLNGAPKAAAPLASDDFLFEQHGPTFGAVVVQSSSGGAVSDDFVDPVLQERRERKLKEKQLKRVTKKLESNRDLYAEMAAARLKSMRKDAKTKPRPSVVHRRRGEDDDDDEEDEDGWSDGEAVDDERYRAVSAAETSRTSKTSTPKAMTPRAMAPFELEEIDSEDEPFIKRQSLQETASKKKNKSKRSSKARDEPAVEAQQEDVQEQNGEADEQVDARATTSLLGEDDFLFGEASMPAERTAETKAAVSAAATTAEEMDEEEARRLRREKRRLKRLQQEQEEAERLQVVERRRQVSVSSGPVPDEPERRSSMDDQWQRATESQKRKDERRRARKEKARQEAEAAAAAEELARQHREEMKRLEEEELKQEHRERKERKKSKEKSALEKKAKELKKKEAELLAEAEKLKQTQEALKADEIKDVARKTKRRDKYTPPTERIQRRDKEVEQAAALATSTSEALSTALVVVEPAPAAISTATMTEPSALPAVERESVVVPPASAPVVVTATVPPAATEPAVAPAAPVSAPTTPAVTPETASTPNPTTVPAAPQSAPTMQVPVSFPAQAQYTPGYPATTPFAMPMGYAAPYSAVHYAPGGYPTVVYTKKTLNAAALFLATISLHYFQQSVHTGLQLM